MISDLALQALRILFAYLLGAAVAVSAFAVSLWVASLLMPESDFWGFMALGIIAALALPLIYVFGVYFAIVVSWLPALAAVILAEAGRLTLLWSNLAVALAVALVSGLIVDPHWFDEMGATKAILSLCYIVGALAGGVVYWAVAGRKAGLWRKPQA